LNLDLYNHRENNYNSIWKINEFYPQLSKKSEEDILKNPLCGMKNLINTFYINSSLQIIIHNKVSFFEINFHKDIFIKTKLL
jgi:uncharacterized UBP type Zn finger protein